MWRIQKKEKFDIWENDLCSLKVQYEENKCRVYVNYKGYNVVIPMGMYGFEDEIQERKIKYEVEVICPLSSRQVKYLKLDVDDACISF